MGGKDTPQAASTAAPAPAATQRIPLGAPSTETGTITRVDLRDGLGNWHRVRLLYRVADSNVVWLEYDRFGSVPQHEVIAYGPPNEPWKMDGLVVNVCGRDLVLSVTAHQASDVLPYHARGADGNMFILAGVWAPVAAVGINWPAIPTTPTFPDVQATSPFFVGVELLHGTNAIGGYDDGTFRPNNPVTRGQMAKVYATALLNLLGGSVVNMTGIKKGK